MRRMILTAVVSSVVFSHCAFAAGLLERAEPLVGRGVVFVTTDLRRFAQRTPKDMDVHRLSYIMLDRCAAARPGRGMYLLRPPLGKPQIVPLVEGKGWVAGPEVSWDGRRIVFAMCPTGESWFHIYELDVPAPGEEPAPPRQLTRGPVDDVMPAYLPDGRIVFSSSRNGYRDEYHAHFVENLHTMNADGSDIRQISFYNNDEWEPSIAADGRILFSRWQVFNMTNKVEQQIHACFPDGTGDDVVFGPELHLGRNFYKKMHYTQPRQMPDGRIACMSAGGINLVANDDDRELLRGGVLRGPGGKESKVRCGTPYPLGDGLLLVNTVAADYAGRAAKGKPEKKRTPSGRTGLGVLDVATGELGLLHDDPAAACFDPVAVAPRRRPPNRVSRVQPGQRTGRLLCLSAYDTREDWRRPAEPYRVQVVEIIPTTYRAIDKHHVGGLGRVLGRAPVAGDGSFFVEIPADTSVALELTDPDGRVIAAMHTWIYVRPGESRTCVGCHHVRKVSGPPRSYPRAAGHPQRLYADRPLHRYRMWSAQNGLAIGRIASEETRLLRTEGFNRTWMELDVFLRSLRHPDAPVRQSAAEAVGQLGATEAEAGLIALLSDPAERVRREAAMALGACGGRGALGPLAEALGDEAWAVRRAARGSVVWLVGREIDYDADAPPAERKRQAATVARELAGIGHADRDRLLDELASGDPLRAAPAARALGRLGFAAAAPALRKLLPDAATEKPGSYDALRLDLAVIDALGRLGDAAAVKPLLAMLPAKGRLRDRDATRERAMAAIDALARIGDSRAIGPLTRLAADPPIVKRNRTDTNAPEVGFAAMAALTRLPARRCGEHLEKPALLGCFGSDRDRMLAIENDDAQRYAGYLTRREGLAGPLLDDALKDLGIGGKRSSSRTRRAARRVAVLADAPDLAPELLAAIAENRRDRWATVYLCRALGRLGNREVVPGLVELLAETPPEAEAGFSAKAFLERNGWRQGGSEPDDYKAHTPRVKAAYCYALGQIGDPRAVEALCEVLADGRHILDTRHAAATALGMIAAPAANPALREAAANDLTHIVRRTCTEALEAISGRRPYGGIYADFPE